VIQAFDGPFILTDAQWAKMASYCLQPTDPVRSGSDKLCSVGAYDPVVSLFLLSLIMMPFNGEEHARAQHENFERNEDYREPIHYFEYFQAIT